MNPTPTPTPYFFDIHTHANFVAFDADRDEVVKRALEAGVWMNVVGTQKDTSRAAVRLSEKYKEGMYATVGLHPIHSDKSFHDTKELGEGGKEFTSRGEVFDPAFYRELAGHPKVVAIGECGLDYYRLKIEDTSGKEEIEKQEIAFRKQIELAVEVKKPLMLHLRNGSGRSAYREALSILTSYNLNHGSAPGDLHFFAGSIDEAKPFLDLGFSFSFTGVITFARDYDEIIKYLPLDRILSETDAPYVTPAPHRGKRNEPRYVVEVVRAIAGIKSIPEEEATKVLFQNACKLFGIPLVKG